MHLLLLLCSAVLLGVGGNCASTLQRQEPQHHGHPLDALPLPVPAQGRRRLAEEDAPEAQSVCEFFQSGRSNPTDCCSWGKYDLCNMSDAGKWISRAAAQCHDCVTSHDLCAHPKILTIHMYLSYLDKTNPAANLLAVKAYLMTQNLLKTRFWLWTDDPSQIMTEDIKPFLEMFSDVVKVKTFVWSSEIEDSPLENSPYFSDHRRLRSDFEDNLAGYSDLVRHLLLYQHGGLWIDNDVVLLRDVYPVTMQVGYQFVMRFVNPHIYFMKKRSALGKRILEQVAKLPFENSDKFVDEVINQTCRPAGYFPVVAMEQYRDYFAFCVLRLVIAADENNGDDLDNVLFDQPLGWWDQHWLNCPNLDTVHGNETSYLDSIGTAMSLHTRYPGHNGHSGPPGSQLQRTIELIDNFFDQCKSRACVHHMSLPLTAFVRYQGPVEHHVHHNVDER